MTDTQITKEDLAYVRAAADRSEPIHIPSIYLLWAVICLCGFPLVDFVGPGSWLIGLYWLIAGPVGGGVTWWLTARAERRAGQVNREEGRRWAFHFLAFGVTGLLGNGMVAAGQLTWTGLTSLWILLLGLTYCLAGLHLERRLMPVGMALFVGYLIALFVPEYGFTVVGVFVALALSLQAYLGTRGQHAAN